MNLPWCVNPTACSDSVGDGVDDLTGAVFDTDFNIEILEECVGKHTVIDVHGIVKPVTVTVAQDGVVQREGGGRGDASGLDVHHAGGIRRAAGSVVAISDGAGVPRDHPDLVGKIAESGNKAGGDVVHEVKFGNRPQAIGGGFGCDHAFELTLVSREAERQWSG